MQGLDVFEIEKQGGRKVTILVAKQSFVLKFSWTCLKYVIYKNKTQLPVRLPIVITTFFLKQREFLHNEVGTCVEISVKAFSVRI